VKQGVEGLSQLAKAFGVTRRAATRLHISCGRHRREREVTDKGSAVSRFFTTVLR